MLDHNKKYNINQILKSNNKSVENHASLKSFNTNFSQLKCKFCDKAHASKLCCDYPSYETKVQRCKELNLCLKCTGLHETQKCKTKIKFPRKNCNDKDHVISICPKSDNLKNNIKLEKKVKLKFVMVVFI